MNRYSLIVLIVALLSLILIFYRKMGKNKFGGKKMLSALTSLGTMMAALMVSSKTGVPLTLDNATELSSNVASFFD